MMNSKKINWLCQKKKEREKENEGKKHASCIHASMHMRVPTPRPQHCVVLEKWKNKIKTSLFYVSI